MTESMMQCRISAHAGYHGIHATTVDRQTMFTDSELPGILVKARHKEELTEIELRKYGAYLLSMLANAEAAHFQHSKGLLSDEHLESLVQGLLRHIRNHHLGMVHWKAYRPEFVGSFQVYMDEQLWRIGVEA
ncbi:MAG: hypothetical protein O3A63_20965 [Proteobacteria bacterium]|nr:hypothetical protein [Pseudomonadota bacterium]